MKKMLVVSLVTTLVLIGIFGAGCGVQALLQHDDAAESLAEPEPAPVPTPVLSPAIESSVTPTPAPTPKPTPIPPTSTPTVTPEITPDPTPTPTATPELTPTPAPSATPEPTSEPTPDPTPDPTETPTPAEPLDIPYLEVELQAPLEEGEIWVLVDISEQKLRLFCYDKVILETGTVTGHATNHPTRLGEFAIYAKARNRTLRGTGYSCFVKYWMPFDGGIGLHDASWRSASKFGTDEYLTNGSHGCVNLPPADAETIYENVEVGTRVVVQA